MTKGVGRRDGRVIAGGSRSNRRLYNWSDSVARGTLGSLGYRGEARRGRLNSRRVLIQAVREIVEKEEQIKLPGLINTATYSAIRPHLKPEVRQSLESDVIEVIPESPVGRTLTHKNMVLDEMTRLEREWNLL